MRNIATLRAAAVSAALTLATPALGACGTTEAPPDPSSSSAGSGPVTITDSRGKEVTLDQPATRVVGLEWGEVEMLVTLGVMPIGVADVEGYGTWVSAAKLDTSVTDVGTRGEPSVDSIAALQPDLVVMEAMRDTNLVDQLEQFVPVIVTKGSDASRNLERMREDFTLIAAAVGKDAEAEQILAGFDKALADGKQKIASAGAEGKYFAMADGWQDGSNISIRMFGQGALVTEVAEELGLRNAWAEPVDEAWGLGATDVEGLTKLQTTGEGRDLHFFYNASDGADVFADGLSGNAIWTAFPFVQQGSLHKMPDGIWTFGGPASCRQYLDAILQVYAG